MNVLIVTSKRGDNWHHKIDFATGNHQLTHSEVLECGTS